MIYTSNRKFQIWAYTASHSFLLLRSPQLFEDVDGYSSSTNFNIDIEFCGVGYLDLPDILQGILIQEINEDIPPKFIQYLSLGYKIFQINSEGKSFFIVAGGYMIGKNNWVSESRVSDFNLEYDEIIAHSLI